MGPVFELQITPQNHYYYLLYHSPLKKREGDFLAEKLPAVVSGIVTGVDRTGQLLAAYFSPDVLVTVPDVFAKVTRSIFYMIF